MTDNTRQKPRTRAWLAVAVLFLAIISLAQSWVIFSMWKSDTGRTRHLVPWLREQASRLFPTGTQGTETPATRADDDRMLVLQSADDLEHIHAQINKILNDLMADFSRKPLSERSPGTPPHAQSNGQRPSPLLMADDIRRIQQEMNTIFESAFSESALSSLPSRFDTDWDKVQVSSSMNIEDAGDHYTITLSMPGIDKSNIVIRIQGQLLSISANQDSERQVESQENTVTGAVRRRNFETAIRLPGPVDADGARATYEDNTLDIQLPKRADKEPLAQHIKVR